MSASSKDARIRVRASAAATPEESPEARRERACERFAGHGVAVNYRAK
jgi:hypothetical protein